VGGRQWAEPFEAEMALTEGLADLAWYTVRFGDRRAFPGEDFQTSLARIEGEVATGVIEWAFVFRREPGEPSGASAQA
jgi:hypothetical protein